MRSWSEKLLKGDMIIWEMVKNKCLRHSRRRWWNHSEKVEQLSSISSEKQTGEIACVCVTLSKEQADSPHACLADILSFLFLISSYLAPKTQHSQFPKSALTPRTIPPHDFKSGCFIDATLTKKLLPQAFPSLMGKLNLTTGGATDVSSVPWQFTLSRIRLRISKLVL